MTKHIKIDQWLVSSNWLYQNIDATNLVVLDATIQKVTQKSKETTSSKEQIITARFFDLKKVFSVQNAPFPNTMLSPEIFEKKASELGIQKESAIVVYDAVGMYSSARVWWLFKSMGFVNIAVLNGGFPAWKKSGFPIETPNSKNYQAGNFKANYQSKMICKTEEVLSAITDLNIEIVDARSEGRFYARELEPREGLRGGHIPNSVSLPYTEMFDAGLLVSEEKLSSIFARVNPESKKMIFSCGSGITACILALGAEISGYENVSVYDGSWTEWGSRLELPIEK